MLLLELVGQHIRSMQHIDYIIRVDSEKYIDDNDTRKLVDNVKKLRLEPGEEIIHVLAQEYKIDNEANILKPEGMCGSVRGQLFMLLLVKFLQ